MIKNIIRYVGLALVIVGVVLVMKNLFTNVDTKSNVKDKEKVMYYTANIELLDKSTNEYVVGAGLSLKDENGELIEEWITDNSNHIVINLTKGTYKLEQVKVSDGYLINEEVITFEISNGDKDVVMYNEKEEVKIVSDEVGVDNTLSTKSVVSVLISLVSIAIGILFILKNKVIEVR